MANAYCTKCGMRASTKCPHCRHVFSKTPPVSTHAGVAQETLEMFLITKQLEDPSPHTGEAKYIAGMWTFAKDSQEALSQVLRRLKECFDAGANLEVAACIHDWELLPGERSSIGCGHVGPDAEVPPDPFAPTTS